MGHHEVRASLVGALPADAGRPYDRLMTCPQCLIALAGFGEDDVPAVDTYIPTDMAQAVGPSVATVVPPAGAVGGVFKAFGQRLLGVTIGGVSGSLLFALAGALLWTEHRVLGGVLGFLGGGVVGAGIGGLVGSKMAKDTLSQINAGGPPYRTGGLLEPGWPPSGGGDQQVLPGMTAGPLMLGPGTISSDRVTTIGASPPPSRTAIIGRSGTSSTSGAGTTAAGSSRTSTSTSASSTAAPSKTTQTSAASPATTASVAARCAAGYVLDSLGRCVLQASQGPCPAGTVKTVTGGCAPTKATAPTAAPVVGTPTIRYVVQPDPRTSVPNASMAGGSVAYGGQIAYPTAAQYGGAATTQPRM